MESLTREEKVRLLSGVGAWNTYSCNGKLPSIMMTDGPHGLRKQDSGNIVENNLSRVATCFPTASAIASSWNTEAVAKMAAAIAREALAEKVSIVLGCGINIKRSPLCGRNFEYFSEDPFLTGTLAIAYIKAMEELEVGTSLKHFAANSQETNRQTSNSQIDERALREIYLQAFEMVVKEAQPTTIMASYNRLNGEYACANKRLLTEILRNEWGFKGTVISDWGAAADVVKCIKAGMDLEMPDNLGIHSAQLLKALEQGQLAEEELDRAVSKVCELVKSLAAKVKDCTVDYGEHHKLAKQLECESAVLLKNDGFLPIEKGTEVLVVGEMAVDMRFQGGGSSHITTIQTPNAVESLKKAGINVIYAQGYHIENEFSDEHLEKEAMEYAKKGLPILFFGGLTEKFEGEGYDRKTLAIPSNQTKLFHKLYEIHKKVAFISFGGSAMDISFEKEASAILHMYLGGQAVGEACADLITGEVNPSGKLAETFPTSIEDVPCYLYYGKKSDDVEYRESLYVGYRYYETFHKPVRFPFGHGLSYTNFEYSHIKLSRDVFDGDGMEVIFTITNTGTRSGKEIAQVYIQNPECNYLRALIELRGFKKVELEPGEQKQIHILLNQRSFSIYDEEKKAFIMPKGDYQILVGASVRDIRLQAEISVQGEAVKKDDRERLKEYFEKQKGSFQITQKQFEVLLGRPISHFDDVRKGEFTVYHSLEQLAKYSLLGKIALKVATIAAYKLNKGKSKDSPEVMMFIHGIREGMLDSVICNGGGMAPYKLAEAIVLSANGHHLKAMIKLIRRAS